jgi:hypothetical protein
MFSEHRENNDVRRVERTEEQWASTGYETPRLVSSEHWHSPLALATTP